MLISSNVDASVVRTWRGHDVGAAIAWLNEVEATPSRAGAFFYSTTAGDPPFSDSLTANLTVWADRAELNLFGSGPLPRLLTLAGVFPGLESILLIDQEQLLLTAFGSYTYSTNFAVEAGFSRIVAVSAGNDGLWLRADIGNGSPEVYTFRASAVPEPSTITFLFFASTLLLRRKKMRIGSPEVVSSRVPHHPAYGSV